MPKITLVPDKHDKYVLVGVVAQLAQPPLHVLVWQMLGDVVHEQRAHRAAVVRRRDGAVPLLARSVPYLGFYSFAVHLRTMYGCFLIMYSKVYCTNRQIFSFDGVSKTDTRYQDCRGCSLRNVVQWVWRGGPCNILINPYNVFILFSTNISRILRIISEYKDYVYVCILSFRNYFRLSILLCIKCLP